MSCGAMANGLCGLCSRDWTQKPSAADYHEFFFLQKSRPWATLTSPLISAGQLQKSHSVVCIMMLSAVSHVPKTRAGVSGLIAVALNLTCCLGGLPDVKTVK